MPRSFLVKKHFSASKKPNYSELESQTGACRAGPPPEGLGLLHGAGAPLVPGGGAAGRLFAWLWGVSFVNCHGWVGVWGLPCFLPQGTPPVGWVGERGCDPGGSPHGVGLVRTP